MYSISVACAYYFPTFSKHITLFFSIDKLMNYSVVLDDFLTFLAVPLLPEHDHYQKYDPSNAFISTLQTPDVTIIKICPY